jgi:peptidoglycan/LPS O-acetylase OafA/YrhL
VASRKPSKKPSSQQAVPSNDTPPLGPVRRRRPTARGGVRVVLMVQPMKGPGRGTDPLVPMADSPAVPTSRFPALDGVRALASLAVLTTHVAFQTGLTNKENWAAGALARLDGGVALFFVLSGFLLFLPFVRRRASGGPRPATPRYLWRRALRIMPAYWAAAAACLLLLPKNDDATIADWVRHAFLLQSYPSGSLRDGLTQTWSLCTEVAFYVALPVLAVVALGVRGRYRPVRTLVALLAMSVLTVTWLLIAGWVPRLTELPSGSWLPGHLSWFAAGMALAVFRVERERAAQTPTQKAQASQDTDGQRRGRFGWIEDLAAARGSCWLLALMLFLIAATPVAGPRVLAPSTGWEMVAKDLLYGAAAGLAVLPLVVGPGSTEVARGGVAHRVLGSPVGHWLGEISYSVFLWHLLVLAGVLTFFDIEPFTGHFLTVYGLTLAGSLPVATVSYLVLERPLMGARRGLRERKPGQRQGAQEADANRPAGRPERAGGHPSPASAPRR